MTNGSFIYPRGFSFDYLILKYPLYYTYIDITQGTCIIEDRNDRISLGRCQRTIYWCLIILANALRILKTRPRKIDIIA